ncbi:phosphoribosylformylglycinamidine cyclo-ligase [candidate division WOR-3 bacterium]|nr:phosphoribosylformylglycinamidine cyclo-ligase [candidate division WOR-3 bacterium]
MKYSDSGVDIEKAESALSRVKKLVKTTFNDRVVQDIGNFGALFSAGNGKYLVSSADGVGTKLKVAFATDTHSTVGQDLVNHCVNDILTLGANPLFFLDYFASGKLEEKTFESVMQGLVEGCRKNSCCLIGGETAEMPGFYKDGEYDIAGFIVGEVQREKIIGSQKVCQNDLIYGFESSGLHTNGFSLARMILNKNRIKFSDYQKDFSSSWGEALLKVHRTYFPLLKDLLAEGDTISSMAHITGGGIGKNLKRSIPHGLDAVIEVNWQIPPLFQALERIGKVPEDEMFLVFNMGMGMLCSVHESKSEKFEHYLLKKGEPIHRIGYFEKGTGEVRIAKD